MAIESDAAARAAAVLAADIGDSTGLAERALESIARSWTVDGECQLLALVDALAWGTLSLAAAVRNRRPDPTEERP